MRSNIVVDIDAPKHIAAALYADPRNNTAWMDDVERCEPVTGEQGMPGSSYRLIPRDGKHTFTATVVGRNLPYELKLSLDSPTVKVDVQAHFTTLPDGRPRMASDETIQFKRPLSRAFGLLVRPVIHKAHRHHMQAFKNFAEGAPRIAPVDSPAS